MPLAGSDDEGLADDRRGESSEPSEGAAGSDLSENVTLTCFEGIEV